MFRKFFLLIIFIIFSSYSYAKELEIQMLNKLGKRKNGIFSESCKN